MENTDVKFNLLRLKSLILQKKYSKNIDNSYKNNIIFLMNQYINKLKEIDLIYTMADIESIKYNQTSYPDTLLNNETINRYNFYSIILGFIDGNIDYLKTKSYNENSLNNNKIYLLNLLNYRKIVINDINNNIYNSDPKILIDTINTVPCYKNFLNCFNNIYSYNNLEIIISYTVGYINFDKFYYDEIYNEYLKLSEELNIFKNNNKQKVKKTKNKKRL